MSLVVAELELRRFLVHSYEGPESRAVEGAGEGSTGEGEFSQLERFCEDAGQICV